MIGVLKRGGETHRNESTPRRHRECSHMKKGQRLRFCSHKPGDTQAPRNQKMRRKGLPERLWRKADPADTLV